MDNERLERLKRQFAANRTAEKEFNKKYRRVKCNCGCYMKDHFEKRGWCSKNGCTWYWPNDKYLFKQQTKARLSN